MPETSTRQIFITGGTGYMGGRLIAALLQRSHFVRALARAGSEQRLLTGCEIVLGNALEKKSYADKIQPADTFVHLIGVPHPNPSKAEQFRQIDLASVQAAVPAAQAAGVQHFVYVSVAHPAPIMQAYWQVRAECEALIRGSGLPATFLRPWYVLGPGHRWPYLLVPLYWLCERIPSKREMAQRLGLVKLEHMVAALVWAIENPPRDVRVMDAIQIRRMRLGEVHAL
ncbi:MAG: SDR family oxidoreductase [bacterium]